MPTLADSLTAVETLKGLLQSAFDDDYADQLEGAQDGYNGVVVLTEDDSPSSADAAGLPYVRLVVVEDEDGDDWGFWYRKATVEADCVGGEFNGGLKSDGGTAIQTMLSRCLQQFVETQYDTLNGAGIQGAMINGPKQSRETPDGGPPVYHCTHRIVFRYRTQ